MGERPEAACVAPNGTRLEFHQSPYRHYRINPTADEPMHKWTEAEPWGCVPSVTAILGVLDKSGPLVGWATNVTCEGAWRMTTAPTDPAFIVPLVENIRHSAALEMDKKKPKAWLVNYLCRRADQFEARGYSMPKKWRGFQGDLHDARLSHRSVTKEAQLRGTTVHQIGEDWVNTGKLPVLSDYPVEWQGYVRAISKFLMAHGEGLSVAEQITGSVKYGFAGTCDTVAVATFEGARVRLDYKTSKQTYARTHFRQLGAYELGAVEGGDEPTDRLGIVILRPDGEFTISYADEVEWRTTPADSFLRVLDVFRDEVPLKAHEDATYKARVARERAAK